MFDPRAFSVLCTTLTVTTSIIHSCDKDKYSQDMEEKCGSYPSSVICDLVQSIAT